MRGGPRLELLFFRYKYLQLDIFGCFEYMYIGRMCVTEANWSRIRIQNTGQTEVSIESFHWRMCQQRSFKCLFGLFFKFLLNQLAKFSDMKIIFLFFLFLQQHMSISLLFFFAVVDV